MSHQEAETARTLAGIWAAEGMADAAEELLREAGTR